ncbi:MAG: hypothetical protein WKF31_07500 [Thermoleophilaceae bacterium]
MDANVLLYAVNEDALQHALGTGVARVGPERRRGRRVRLDGRAGLLAV